MAPVIKAALLDTKWGPAVDFEGRLIFLHYLGNVKDFEIGKEYTCEIFWYIWFAQHPNGANKGWAYLESDTLEGLTRHPGFKKYNLDVDQARPRFSIKL